ncbi:hypothetical protein SBRY_70269 [Actinacidiphila bryophytorum]|uniref:Uncharacterized protein n=1 Tax=Actinacidiphila bryophytorum TaxID=1436133 RepID=A0A9W4H7D9_9ACTN|nr:hypothetical protein SBRY_70269 [Actinacidiphila bryophytorum]
MGVQQHQRPEVDGQRQAAGERRGQQVPRRARLQHRQRHPAGRVDLQRRRQPAVDGELTPTGY